MGEVANINNKLIFIYDRAQDIHDVSLVVEQLVAEAEEMFQLRPEKRNVICGMCIAIDCLFEWMREQLQLIMMAADGKDIANLKEGGEQVA